MRMSKIRVSNVHRSARIAVALASLFSIAIPGLASAAPKPPAHAVVGQKAPDFALKDTEGKEHRLSDYLAQGKTVVLEWFNPDCPFVRRHHEKEKTMQRLEAAHRESGIVWLAINSGAPGKQGAGLERNKQAKSEYGIAYPILLDESGEVGRSYGAKTTPHMFVIPKDGILVYAGGIDDDPRGSKPDRSNYLALALLSCAKGQPIANSKTEPYGCSVKYGGAAAQ